MKRIEAHPADSSFTIGVNQFSDLTWEEFKQGYLTEETENTLFAGEAPESKEIDHTTYTTDVKNQGQCGSCWAFSTTGSFEYFLNKKDDLKKDDRINLSEQELVDCSRSYGNYGCRGGLMSGGFKYVMDHKLGTQANYPYDARDHECNAGNTAKEPRYSVAGFKELRGGVEELSKWLDDGPVSVALEVNYAFQAYTSGVFVSEGCGSRLNHGVTLVGQGKDEGKDFFRVKNSWGSSWGEKGYIRMAVGTGSGTCGIANGWDVVPTF